MSERITDLCNKVADIKYDAQQVLDELHRLEHEEHERFTQFLIAQALMARPNIFESFDYEDIWLAASRLLPEYLESDLRDQGTDFQVVDTFLDTIPVSTLKSLDS